MRAIEEQQLLQAVAEGDEAAFTAVVERHRLLVWHAARACVGEAAADDVCQAVFLLLLRKARRLSARPEPIGSWLLGACRRIAANHRRAEARRKRREAHAATCTAPAEDPVDDQEQRSQLLQAMSELPERLRGAMLAHYIDGLPRAAVAEQLGISTAACDKRLQRGVHALRTQLQRRGLSVFAIPLVPSLPEGGAPSAAVLSQAALHPTSAMITLATGGTMTVSTVITAILAVLTVGTGSLLLAAETPPAPASLLLPQQIRLYAIDDLLTHPDQDLEAFLAEHFPTPVISACSDSTWYAGSSEWRLQADAALHRLVAERLSELRQRSGIVRCQLMITDRNLLDARFRSVIE